jgi:hypothetical protein
MLVEFDYRKGAVAEERERMTERVEEVGQVAHLHVGGMKNAA